MKSAKRNGEIASECLPVRATLKVVRKLDPDYGLAKIYGTRKPGGIRVSRFYGGSRREDERLKQYLLGLSVEPRDDVAINVGGDLPYLFKELLSNDERAKQLWEGMGKTEGDTSCSGYDFSLVKKCLRSGITDVKDLYRIVAMRPEGGVRASGKGDKYIRLTIANAIKQ